LINQERERQNLFTYKIGVGISYGPTASFRAGKDYARAELLQIGSPLEIATELEALSKNYQSFPLLLDDEIGKALHSNKEFEIIPQSFKKRKFYIFKKPPETSSYLDSTLKIGKQENHTDTEPVTTRKRNNGLKDFILEKFNQPIIVFLLGCLLLLMPGFYSVSTLVEVYRNHYQTRFKQAQKQNRFLLESEKMPQARKELLEINLGKKLAELTNLKPENFQRQQFKDWEKQIHKELKSYGLKSDCFFRFSPSHF
jgi:hypothetical protein